LNQKVPVPLNGRALDKIRQWTWPGNVRELENVIERAVLLSQGDEISTDSILIEEDKNISQSSSFTLNAGLTIAEMERLLIFKTLDQTAQNRTKAAKLLGISIRTLRNKLHEYQEVNCG